jgi:hypothetical protein
MTDNNIGFQGRFFGPQNPFTLIKLRPEPRAGTANLSASAAGIAPLMSHPDRLNLGDAVRQILSKNRVKDFFTE